MRRYVPLTPVGLLQKLLRVIWARRVVVLVATLCTVLGGIFVLATAPKIYTAKARVILDLVKLDEQTGAPVSRSFTEPYVASQLYFLRDVEITGRVVEGLGWLDSPELMEEYNARDPNDDRDMRTWVAQRLTGATSVGLLPDSNVLEISYRSVAPEAAVQIVDAMRRAYVEASVQTRRNEAQKQREWFENQAREIREQMGELIARRDDLQRETGIVFKNDQTDIETARLKRLTGLQPVTMSIGRPRTSAAEVEQTQLNAQIANVSATYGPNHPTLAALRRRRSIVDAQVKVEEQAMQARVAQVMTSSQAALAQVDLQRQKVGGQASSIATLRQVQDEITVIRELYERVIARAADLQQKAEISDTEVIPIGAAEAEPRPYFPNEGLILGGSTLLGVLLGVTLALLLELLSRRVRGERDLASVTGVPVLGTLDFAERKPLLAGLARRPARPKVKRQPSARRKKAQVAQSAS